MLWSCIALALFVGLPLLLLLVGIGLAIEPRHVASVSFHLARPPNEVFAVIASPADAATWRPDLRSVEMLDPVGGRARFAEHGRQGKVLYEVVRSDPPRLHEVAIADDRLPYGGSWRFELAPADGGTDVRITEDGVVKNPIFRALSRTVFSLTGSLEAYARALAARFGERLERVDVALLRRGKG